MNTEEKFIEFLLEKKLISSEKLEELKKEAEIQNKNLEDLILKSKLIDIEVLIKAKAEFKNFKYISLFEEEIDNIALNIIPLEVADNYGVVCFYLKNQDIKVGVTNLDNLKAFEAVDFLVKKKNLNVDYYLISEESFKHAYKKYQSINSEVFNALKAKEEEEKEFIEIKEKDIEKTELEEVVKSAPVTKIVSVIIRHAVEGCASDVHIEPLLKETRVRYRIDGIMTTSLILPKNIHYAVVARIKVLANLKLDETRTPQEGRIRLLIDGKEIDFRVSIIPLVDSEKVVMRILDVTKGAPTLGELGFSDTSLKVIRRNIKKTYGIFLVTGPTGSGKSTTLFSVLNILNKDGVNISTLEDPVEYYIQGVNQSQIRPNLGFTFASGLRTLLRQDPDIMMVGEIRDNETAELAIHSALTGHLVLSTLHTNDALGAIPRLIDMKVEHFLLSSVLNAIIAQRLVRRICPNCKIMDDSVPEDILAEYKKEIQKIPVKILEKRLKKISWNNFVFYKGKGCTRCINSGYEGRIAISESIDIVGNLKHRIQDYSKPLTTEEILETQDFVTLKQDGIIKILQGVTTVEEILRVANN